MKQFKITFNQIVKNIKEGTASRLTPEELAKLIVLRNNIQLFINDCAMLFAPILAFRASTLMARIDLIIDCNQ